MRKAILALAGGVRAWVAACGDLVGLGLGLVLLGLSVAPLLS